MLDPEDEVRPQSVQPVIHLNEDGERQIEMMCWAFKRPDRLLFNARSEGIEQATFWRESFLMRRCIVPADAAYEWQEPRKGKTKPKYEFTILGREPFVIAGVWKIWENSKLGIWERTFAVLTGEANEVMQPINERMTTFLDPRDFEEYLAPSERPPIHLLSILAADRLRAKPVEKTAISNRQVGLFDSQ